MSIEISLLDLSQIFMALRNYIYYEYTKIKVGFSCTKRLSFRPQHVSHKTNIHKRIR